MASAVIMMAVGAVANATAFIGGNAVYHALDSQNAAEERKRHDLAIEKLQKQSAAWSQNRIKHLDFLAEQRQKTMHAKSDILDMKDAIRQYDEINPQPKLTHYYAPSDQQKKYEQAYIAASVIGSAAISKFM